MNAKPFVCASVIVEDEEGKFPMQFRDSNPTSDPMKWAFIGGFKDPEDPDTRHTAQRELSEELNMDVALEDLHYLGKIVMEQRNLVNDVYCLRPRVPRHGTVFNEGAGGAHLSSGEIIHLDSGKQLAGTTKRMIEELLWSPWSAPSVAA